MRTALSSFSFQSSWSSPSCNSVLRCTFQSPRTTGIESFCKDTSSSESSFSFSMRSLTSYKSTKVWRSMTGQNFPNTWCCVNDALTFAPKLDLLLENVITFIITNSPLICDEVYMKWFSAVGKESVVICCMHEPRLAQIQRTTLPTCSR